MDFITSYSSSDSETELSEASDDKQPVKVSVAALPKVQDTLKPERTLASHERSFSPLIKYGMHNTTSKSNSSHIKNDLPNLKRNIAESNHVVPSNRNTVKPYIPKSKRTKITVNEVGSSSDEVASHQPTKLSGIFQNASILTQESNLQYRVPRNQVSDFEAHQGCVNRIVWNPNFADFLLSASMDAAVRIWNVQTNPSCVYTIQNHGQAVKDAKWDHSGLQILSGGYDKMARITDVNYEKQLCELKHNSFVTSVQYHPSDCNIFLSGTAHDGIFAWDIRTQTIAMRYKSFFGQVQDIVFHPNGESFISAAEVLKRNSTDKGIMVWDYKTSTILSNQIFQEAYTCTALQIHPKDNVFLAQCNAGYIAVFSQKPPYKLNKYKRFEGHQVSGYHIGLDISPDGSLVASGSADGSVTIYNYRTSNIVKTFSCHSQPCMDVVWSPSQPSLLASCGWDGKIVLHK